MTSIISSPTRPADVDDAAQPGPATRELVRLAGGREVKFRGGVARFREDDGYNDSFARQWKAFRLTQYDEFNGTTLTRDRYLRETGWPLSGLDGETVLEAGCGAGRFTRILAQTGATVIAVDYSSAVDVSAEQNGRFPNVAFAQCDLLDLPFRPHSFDRVFCHGVIQHTPDPTAAFRALDAMVKPGGLLSIDVYLKDGKIRPWKSKYLWRRWTTRIAPARLLGFLEWFIPKWLPVDTLIKRIPVLGTYLGAIVPCWNYFYTELPPKLKTQWAILDTFDALAPAHDHPVTLAEVARWFRGAGYMEVEVREGGNGVVGNGRKPR
jgi:SAM-dependent methyltransferase